MYEPTTKCIVCGRGLVRLTEFDNVSSITCIGHCRGMYYRIKKRALLINKAIEDNNLEALYNLRVEDLLDHGIEIKLSLKEGDYKWKKLIDNKMVGSKY